MSLCDNPFSHNPTGLLICTEHTFWIGCQDPNGFLKVFKAVFQEYIKSGRSAAVSQALRDFCFTQIPPYGSPAREVFDEKFLQILLANRTCMYSALCMFIF